MREMCKRPLALAGLLFYGAASLLAAMTTVWRITAGALGLVLLAVLPIVRGGKHPIARRNGIATAAALLLAAILSIFAVDVRIARAERYAGETSAVVGTVREVAYTNEYSGQYVISAVSIDGKHTGVKIRLSSADPSLRPGDSVLVTGTLTLLPENDNGFPARRYYRSRGIFLAMETEDDVTVIGSEETFSSFVAGLRERLSGIYASLLPKEDAGLVSALLLGDKSGLADSAVRDFRALGISHLLAISGLHLTVLMGAFEALLRLFRLRRRVRRLILAPVVITFMILCGLPASVVRAGCMMLISIVMSLIARREDLPSALAYAVALIVIVSPDAMFDVGLQLSVAAMFGCFVSLSYGKMLPGMRGRLFRYVVQPLLTTLTVVGTILPLSAIYYGETSLSGPVMTVIFSPLVSLLLLLSPLLPLVSAAPTVSAVFAFPVRIVADAVLTLASFFAPHAAVVSLHYAAAPLLVAAVFLTVLLFPDVRKKARIILLAFLAVSVLIFTGNVLAVQQAEKTRVTVSVVNTKKNDTHYVLTGGEAVLIDFSDGSMSALKPALALLDSGTHTSIDAVVLTHYHQRHIATVTSLFSERFIGAVLLPEPVTEAEAGIADAIERAADAAGVRVCRYAAGSDMIALGAARFLVSERTMISRSTHPTLSMTVFAFGKTYVYIGSSACEGALAAALEDTVPAADAVVFGIHGPIGKKPIPLAPRTDALVGVSGDVALLSENAVLNDAVLFPDGMFTFVFEEEY